MKRVVVFLLVGAMLLCLAGCKNEPKSNRPDMDALKAAEVGSYIYFGEYEQDNDESTGKEAIEWLVLDKQDDKMLVTSRYALDCQYYNTEKLTITWEECTLRNWCNSAFYEAAFISEEKNVILASMVKADNNPMFGTPAGNDTTDKVFLLSIDEQCTLLSEPSLGACQPTPYCEARGAIKADNGNCTPWLRSPGLDPALAAVVDADGKARVGGTPVMVPLPVRPAMWIYLTP